MDKRYKVEMVTFKDLEETLNKGAASGMELVSVHNDREWFWLVWSRGQEKERGT